MKNKIEPIATHRNLPEQLVYLVAWALVFLFPIVNNLLETLPGEEGFCWQEVYKTWKETLPFLLLFGVNHYLLLPYLFFRKRILLYVVVALFASLLVVTLASSLRPNRSRMLPKMDREWVDRGERGESRPQMAPPHAPATRFPCDAMQKPQPPSTPNPPFGFTFLRAPFIGRILIALLMLSFNVAVKLFFKSIQDDEMMRELTSHNLKSQLEYLKYQINPHFFMNTLNNIHALVDIDTEKAKETLVELSRLMRYVLYEANHRMVPLAKEVDFLQHYVELMRIRYTEHVSITFQVTSDLGSAQIPPLLLISFVENAFKHGISYQHPSFVAITLGIVEDELVFRCVNSNFGKRSEKHQGIGLDNIGKRLQLLFGNHYSFSIREELATFEVVLSIPITYV